MEFLNLFKDRPTVRNGIKKLTEFFIFFFFYYKIKSINEFDSKPNTIKNELNEG